MWSISRWQELIQLINGEGYMAILPSGSIEEFERGKEIASISTDALAIPAQSLNRTAYIIENATGCICSDTGLAHLSALLGKPSVTLYSVTDEKLIGTRGNNQTHIISCDSRMDSITSQKAWQELELLIGRGGGGGIRTPEGFNTLLVFKTSAFNQTLPTLHLIGKHSTILLGVGGNGIL